MTAWQEQLERAAERCRDGEARVDSSADEDARQRQLTRIGNAAYAAGLASLMLGDRRGAVEWLSRAAARYRESYADAPPGSWGRLIAILKARLLAGDRNAAEEDARWTLEQQPDASGSPIGRYAACLALLVVDRDTDARVLADELRIGDGFPAHVGDALATVAAGDRIGYVEAIESVLESFESRDEYLEDIAVADTVLVLQALARRRDLAAELESALLPPR